MLTTYSQEQFADIVSGLVGTPVTKDTVIKFSEPLLEWMRNNCYGGFSDELITSEREISVEQLFNVLEEEPK